MQPNQGVNVTTAQTFTPRPAGLHPSRARNAAAFSLLQTLPAGTEVVFDQRPRTGSVSENLRTQRGLSASVSEFRKRFQRRNGLGKLTTRTVAEGDTVTAYVSAEKAEYHGLGRMVDLVTSSAPATLNEAASTTSTSVKVSVTPAKPVANPKRSRAKSAKRRYVHRADTYAKHLETAEKLLAGELAPQYKKTKVVTTWPFNNTSTDKETLKRRAYTHASQLNKLAADRPYKFVTKTAASSVRINVVLD